MSKKENDYAGLDVSLNTTSICVVTYDGQIEKEAVVETEPKEIDAYLSQTGLNFASIGVEASNLTIWLYWNLRELGHSVIPIETRKAAAFMAAQNVKTDRNDARGIAHMMRGGYYTPVHVKSDESQRFKLLLNNHQTHRLRHSDSRSAANDATWPHGHSRYRGLASLRS